MHNIRNNQTYPAKLLKKAEVAAGTFEVVLKLEHPLSYLPGQYVWVEIPSMKFPDARGKRRAFSLTGAPDSNEEISILFRSGESGFKKSILAMEKGEELNVIGPFGSAFSFPEDKKIPLVLVAGGVGIAPFLCLARYAVREKLNTPISVIYADASEEKAAFASEIKKLGDAMPNLQSRVLFSKLSWQDVKDVPAISDSLFYISGPQGFVDHAHTVFSENGVFEDKMRFENFYPTTQSTRLLQEWMKKNFGPSYDDPTMPAALDGNNLFLLAAESSSNHTVMTDANGVIVFANKASEKVTGYGIGEMIGQTPRIWGGMMSKEFYIKFWKSLKNGISVNEEIINRRKHGELYNTIAHVAPIGNRSGDILGFIATEEDVTHIRESESRAVENEERFMQLTERIPEVYRITELNPVERVVYVSPAFEKLWGISRQELYKDPRVWMKNIHPEDLPRVKDAFDALIKENSVLNIQYRIVRPDNSVCWVAERKEIVVSDHGDPARILGVARDITEEKAIDRAKTEFVSLATHQLKTPLGAISWSAEMLMDGDYGELTKKQKEAIGDIIHTNVRMKELVDGLLDVARIDMGAFSITPEPVSCSAVCEDVLTELKPRILAKKHEIIKNYDQKMAPISADPKLLRIIFQNYLSNAVKYTPAKGRVAISMGIIGEEIVISVANNGPMIPKAEQSKIFGRLFRASNAHEMDPDGTGLGLYLVKAIVENGGGRAWFESEEGKDTVFSVAFPLTGMKKVERARTA